MDSVSRYICWNLVKCCTI